MKSINPAMKGICISLTRLLKNFFKKWSEKKRKNNRQFHSTCWTHVETLPEQEEYGSWLYLAAFDGNQKCNPASIDFTFVIQKLFSQVFYFFLRCLHCDRPVPTTHLLTHMLRCERKSAGGNSVNGKGHFSRRPQFHYMLSLVDGWGD